MLTVLFIEDRPDTIRPVKQLIEQDEPDIKCILHPSFQDANSEIEATRPDVVILDLLNDAASPAREEGVSVYEFIWKKHFCPIIVHSAQPDILEQEAREHPFLILIKKGRDSPPKVLESVRQLRPQIDALKEAEKDVRDAFTHAMRDLAPRVFKTVEDRTKRNAIIKRSGRRRLAARMDEPSGDGNLLAIWEQYLWPPISHDILLGDILKKADGLSENPTSFRVVLTPSCDMVTSGSRTPKVRNILVAKCCSMKEGLERIGMQGRQADRDRLLPVLNQGYSGSILPLPSLEGLIPTMAANLRDLEQLSMEDIALEGKMFDRIASVDSPFRELIAWAYLQIAGRPGLPERDTHLWAEEIIEALN